MAGIDAIDVAHLAGGDPAENATLIEALLRGDGPAGARAAVILNAAAAIYVNADDMDYAQAVDLARTGLAQGVGADALSTLRRVSIEESTRNR